MPGGVTGGLVVSSFTPMHLAATDSGTERDSAEEAEAAAARTRAADARTAMTYLDNNVVSPAHAVEPKASHLQCANGITCACHAT